MKSQQTPINGRPKRRPQLPAAATDAALALEERVIWPSEDAARSAGRATRSGLDRALWEFQRRLLWPAQDLVRDLEDGPRMLASAAVVLIAAVAGVAGLLLASSGGSGAGTAPAPVAVTVPKAHAEKTTVKATATPAPTLHGAAPVFKPAKAAKKTAEASRSAHSSAPAQPATEAAATPSSSSAATDKISSSPSSSASSSSASASASSAEPASVEGPPAGPTAIAVAREFADAFVVYETGGTEAKVRSAFKATATPLLARELLRRPPKQPATVKVPRAKVVNVVAAPSQGTVYPVSVSLLRVGVTSELRISMEKTKKSGWQVTNVLG